MGNLVAGAKLTWGEYDGRFDLSDKQVDALVVHNTNLVPSIVGWLDSKFRLKPVADANWPMLGQHLIELLTISDHRAFSGISQQMVLSMGKEVQDSNPFLAASMAEAGLTNNDRFNTLLLALLKQQERNPFGLIPFATGFLNLGDHFSTLWALRLLILSQRIEEFDTQISRAIEALGKSFDLLCEHPDHVGFLLYDLSLLAREQDKPLVFRCLDRLLQPDVDWMNNVPDLRGGGFVAYDLLHVAGLRPEAMSRVESWLAAAFQLTDDPPTRLPEPFQRCQHPHPNREDVHADVWIQGWLRALIASTLYLKLRRPEYVLSSRLLAQSIVVSNERDELADFARLATPYLPAIQEMQSIHSVMKAFWTAPKGAPFDKSVFVMRSMRATTTMEAILQVICQELTARGLVGRYVGDQPVSYLTDLWANNQVYLRGCKYGIAVFERLPRDGVTPFGPNHNVLVEFGFMRGKGAQILMLYDESSMNAPVHGGIVPPEGIGLPPVIGATIYEAFSSEEPDLVRLRQAVTHWAEAVLADTTEKDDATNKEMNDG